MQLNLQNTYVKFLDREGPPVLVSVINVMNDGPPINDDSDELRPIDGIFDSDGNPLSVINVSAIKPPLRLICHSEPTYTWVEVPKPLITPELRAQISNRSRQDDNSFFLNQNHDFAPVHEYLKGLYEIAFFHHYRQWNEIQVDYRST